MAILKYKVSSRTLVGDEYRHQVVSGNNKVVAKCKTFSMASSAAKGLNMEAAQRRDNAINKEVDIMVDRMLAPGGLYGASRG